MINPKLVGKPKKEPVVIVTLSLSHFNLLDGDEDSKYGAGEKRSYHDREREHKVPRLTADGKAIPPDSYICNRCKKGGHYLVDCKADISADPPPPNYICHKCGKGGHWKVDCPLP